MLSLELIGLLGFAYVFFVYLALRSRAASREAHDVQGTIKAGAEQHLEDDSGPKVDHRAPVL